MNTFPQEFYDPLYIALGGDMRLLQNFVDDVLARKYNALQLEGFTFDNDLLPDFTYAQIEQELKMNVMASYVDLDSPAIPIAHEGQTIATGKIPRQKSVEYYNEDKLRKLKQLENRRDITAELLRERAGAGMFDIFDTLVGGHTNALSYQRHQIVSKGEFTLNSTNNPNGIQGVTFAAHVPAGNKTTKTGTARWWTSVSSGVYSSEGSACDPIKDLKTLVRKAKNAGVGKFHIEVQKDYLDQVLEHTKIVAALKDKLSVYYKIDSVEMFTDNQKIDALGSLIGCPIIPVDHQVRIQKFQSGVIVNTNIQSFEDNVFVLIPDGNIGSVKTVEPLVLAGGEYANYYGGKLLLTISKDYSKKCMAYESEMTSICVPDKPKYMFYLAPYGAN